MVVLEKSLHLFPNIQNIQDVKIFSLAAVAPWSTVYVSINGKYLFISAVERLVDVYID